MNNLLGQKFGKLTVIEKTDKRNNRLIVWKCLCDCGNICYLPSSELKRGNVKSCGCLLSPDLTGQKINHLLVLEKTNNRKFGNVLWKCKCDCGNICFIKASLLYHKSINTCGCNLDHNLIGQRFGKLVVIDKTEERNSADIVWLCECDCGSLCKIPTRSLKCGNTHSCGCLKKSVGEYQIEYLLKENKIEYISQYTRKEWKFPNTQYNGRFDFFLPQYNRLVEYDGEQHFYQTELWGAKETLDSRKNKDKIKNEWANKANIDLIRIPYWYKDKITLDLILGDDLLINRDL